MGLGIIHCTVFPKEGDGSFYSMIYQDGTSGKAYAKRFQIGVVTRDKLYPLVKSEGSKVVYFDVSPTEKAMPKEVHISLDGRSKARVREFDFNLSSVWLGNRSAKGLTVTKWAIKEVKKVEAK
jgi:topoisomerase-4 subunit A